MCFKPDNCKVSDDGAMVWCGRVEEGSIKQNRGGQYLHRLKDRENFRSQPRVPVPKPKAELPVRKSHDWQAMAKGYFRSPLATSRRSELATLLGVAITALTAMGVGFDGSAWTFPQWDASRVVIGIQRRFRNGKKRYIPDSNVGLIFGKNWNMDDGPIFLPEGASDVAALMTMGLNAVGRPSNIAGAELIAELLRPIPKNRLVVVLAENDRKTADDLSNKAKSRHTIDCEGCSQCWPGRYGAIETAKKLSAALERPIHYAFPPDGAKDVREWLQCYRHRLLSNNKATSADAPMASDIFDVFGHDFVENLSLNSINVSLPPVEEPTGPEVSLDDWRELLTTRRIKSVGIPGINIDRSGTGYGKTTADNAAIAAVIRKGGKVLVVLPTHENCKERENELTQLGVDAVAYPGRRTDGDDQNCWNTDADEAQEMGLSATAAICPICPKRHVCEGIGYLF